MSSFGAKGLTNKGRVLQAKAQAGTQLKYTKYVLGDGQLGGQSISTLVNVISPKKNVVVSRLKMTPPNQAMVGFVLSNQDVTTGFYFREMGLYALDPDEGEILYWYANAGDTADYIPPTNTGDVVNKTIDMLVYVGTASNVTLTIDRNLAYVTHDELDEALEGLDPDIPDASLTVKGIVSLYSGVDSDAEAGIAAAPKAVKEAILQAKSYTDQQINLVTETGIPKLVSYPLLVTATVDNQKVFEIPLDLFDANTDTLLVAINRAVLDATQYTVTNTIRDGAGQVTQRAKINLLTGVVAASEVTMVVLKNVPLGPDGAINGAVLAVDSIPINRVNGLLDQIQNITRWGAL